VTIRNPCLVLVHQVRVAADVDGEDRSEAADGYHCSNVSGPDRAHSRRPAQGRSSCQDKRGEAHDLLAPVYDWFTEGLETLDLKEAKAMLEELA
jgi:hypothetical protein